MKTVVGFVLLAAIVGGVFTCGLWCLAMIWTDRHFLPKQLQMGPVLLTLNIVSGVVLIDGGRVIDVGTHSELLRTSARYAAVLGQLVPAS